MGYEDEVHAELASSTYRVTGAAVNKEFVIANLAPLFAIQVANTGYPARTLRLINFDAADQIATRHGWIVDGIIGEMMKASSSEFWETILDEAPQQEVLRMANAIAKIEKIQIEKQLGVNPDNLGQTKDISTLDRRAIGRLAKRISDSNAGFYGLSLQYFALAALFGDKFEKVIPVVNGQNKVKVERLDVVRRSGIVTEEDLRPFPIFTAANAAAKQFGDMAKDFDEFYGRLQKLFPGEIDGVGFSAYALLEERSAFRGQRRNCPAKDPVTIALFEGIGSILADPQIGIKELWRGRIRPLERR